MSFQTGQKRSYSNMPQLAFKPAGKEIKLRESSLKKFAEWTDEELEHYATTGEKPKKIGIRKLSLKKSPLGYPGNE